MNHEHALMASGFSIVGAVVFFAMAFIFEARQ